MCVCVCGGALGRGGGVGGGGGPQQSYLMAEGRGVRVKLLGYRGQRLPPSVGDRGTWQVGVTEHASCGPRQVDSPSRERCSLC